MSIRRQPHQRQAVRPLDDLLPSLGRFQIGSLACHCLHAVIQVAGQVADRTPRSRADPFRHQGTEEPDRIHAEDRLIWPWMRPRLRERLMEVGQMRVLRDQAARKFGRRTAGKLARLLAEVHDGEQISRIAEAVVDCDAPDDFLARVRGG